MCEATYFDHMSAEHALMAAASLDPDAQALNSALPRDYRHLAQMLRWSRALGVASRRELEAALLG